MLIEQFTKWLKCCAVSNQIAEVLATTMVEQSISALVAHLRSILTTVDNLRVAYSIVYANS